MYYTSPYLIYKSESREPSLTCRDVTVQTPKLHKLQCVTDGQNSIINTELIVSN